MDPKISMMWATQDAEYQIVRATRICYGSEDKTDSHWEATDNVQQLLSQGTLTINGPMVSVKIGKKDEALLRRIMTNQHNTCLRFASAAFTIDNISRVCSHQLVRIAHFGILQRSQRYCDESNSSVSSPDFPSEYFGKVDKIYKSSYKLYNEMIENGIKQEDARYVLPNATSTKINMVSNFQGWKHFLHIRLAKKVQLETRLVAAEICKQLYNVAPIIFENDYNKIDSVF